MTGESDLRGSHETSRNAEPTGSAFPTCDPRHAGERELMTSSDEAGRLRTLPAGPHQHARDNELTEAREPGPGPWEAEARTRPEIQRPQHRDRYVSPRRSRCRAGASANKHDRTAGN